MQAEANRKVIKIMRRNRIPGMAKITKPLPRPATRTRYGIPEDGTKPLINIRHEAFAMRVAAGDTQVKAVKLAGYAPAHAHVAGSKLIRMPHIRARIEYLKSLTTERAVESIALSKGWVLQELTANVSRAVKLEDLSAANRALELVGKELGMFVERKLIGMQALISELTPENLKNASADELVRLVAGLERMLEGQVIDPEAPTEGDGNVSAR